VTAYAINITNRYSIMLTTNHPTRPKIHPTSREEPLFSFVVVADTHVNEADGVSSSPCETNRLANERARHVFHDIASMDPPPRFVIHLGDIVHPVPSVPTFSDAVAQFKEIAAPLRMPLRVVPGNHDVGDKRIDWMPADQVCDDYLEIYRGMFGPDFYSFDEGDVRFIALNSLLLNSGLDDEGKQKQWVEEQIATAQGKRVFMFMHYPPYVHKMDERGSYDNIDQPARSWLLEQMSLPNVEAVFAGHVHNFWYDRVGQADFYMLPSTAFLRHDLTEFYRIEPAVEFGRGDAEKFGYFVVDVFSTGHVAFSVRTHGARLQRQSREFSPSPIFLSHPEMSTFDRVGAELRHPWTESMQIAATGGVQEFGRKWARNDYPLMALWEMGSRLSKVTDQDFLDDESRNRMVLMARLGHRYILTCLGKVPRSLDKISAEEAGVVAIEINATWKTFSAQVEVLAELRHKAGVEVYLSKIHTFDDSHFDGKHFNHFVKAGFEAKDLTRDMDQIQRAIAAGAIDGITVRVEADENLPQVALEIAGVLEPAGVMGLISLKTSGKNLATERADDFDMAKRTVQAMLLSKRSNFLRYVFDTFMDVDRGYFPRHAFIDRRFDPRAAARAFTAVNTLMSGETTLSVECDGQYLSAVGATGTKYQVVSGAANELAADIEKLPATATVHDILSGEAFTTRSSVAALLSEPTKRLLLLIKSSH
jgi:3',5'-cyclic AMP phosphodiesterase CpdA